MPISREEERPSSQSAHSWGAFVALHFGSALVMIAVMASVPDPSGVVALVYSPATSAAAAFDQAAATGGRIVRVGAAPWIVVVAPGEGDRDFFARARAGGALLILNPLIATGCARRYASKRNADRLRL